ncbi:Major facilitator super domain-containing protein 10 [Desmophyllum pertusum]|uniref:Major facilitator super domain-containing protein 10 n=1 Tax=Desmophyllum pertusum TaxID=174260 RepID=A0A9X0D4M5_9CNID|nr:Major facilitator super domain-containing protein 10 [Desmophyllum pertusum]
MDDLELKHRDHRASKPATGTGHELTPKDGHGIKGAGKSTALPSDRTAWVVFFSLLVDLLAFTVILPLFPSLLEFYASNKKDWLYYSIMQQVNTFREFLGMPDNERFNVVLFGGFIGSLFSFLQFLCCPLIGAMSDVFGRRLPMMLCMMGVLASYVVWAYSWNFTIFVIARIIGGLCKGNVTISTAIITDVTSTKNRGKGMALVGIAYSFGFIIGPVIGAIFAKRSSLESGNPYLLPALFAITLTVADMLFVYFCLKETLPKEKRAKSLLSQFRNASQLLNPVSLLKFDAVEIRSSKEDLNTVRGLGMVYFLFLFFFSGLEFTLTFLTHKNFKYSSMQQGMMFFFIGITMALVQGGYVRRQAPGSEKKTALKGMASIMPAMVIVGLAKTIPTLYMGLALFSFGAATVVPCLTTMISHHGNADQKGKVMGIFRSLGALARAIGPIVSCTVYWSVGPFWCYFVGALLFMIPMRILVKLPAEKK